MKKIIQKTSLILGLFFWASICKAIDFIPLESSSPWMDGVTKGDPKALFQNIYNVGLTVASTLAVIMIMYGGVKYMTTDAWTQKEEAKDIIQSAIFGLVIALTSALILYTINPDILNIRI